MIVLQETSNQQTIQFIPRVSVAGDYVITLDAEFENSRVYNVTKTVADALDWSEKYYYVHSDVFPVKENKAYVLEITKDGKTVFRDNVFCTNQTEYSINNNEYASRSTSNSYITV